MKSLAARIAAAMIACCLSVPAFSQSTTIQDAAKNPAVHKALLQKIERDKQEVRTYKVGHVVVGRIHLEGTDDPEFIRSQMMIFEDGFFSDAVRDPASTQPKVAITLRRDEHSGAPCHVSWLAADAQRR